MFQVSRGGRKKRFWRIEQEAQPHYSFQVHFVYIAAEDRFTLNILFFRLNDCKPQNNIKQKHSRNDWFSISEKREKKKKIQAKIIFWHQEFWKIHLQNHFEMYLTSGFSWEMHCIMLWSCQNQVKNIYK